MTLRDRLLTKPVAEAMMSPGGILLAGAGAAIGIVAGLPLAAAGALGAAGWAARVAVAVPRGPVKERIDRGQVSGEWQRFVDEALASQRRFEAAIDRTPAGALKDRLARLDERIDQFVRESYRIARSGQALTEARGAIDTHAVVTDLHRVTGGRRPEPGSSTEQAARALEAQLASAGRLDQTIGETRSRLIALDARLDEVVARAIELSVTTGDSGSLAPVEADLELVIDEMEAVRLAVEETA